MILLPQVFNSIIIIIIATLLWYDIYCMCVLVVISVALLKKNFFSCIKQDYDKKEMNEINIDD